MIEPCAFGNTGYKYTGDDPRRFILETAKGIPAVVPATYRTDTSPLGVYMQNQIPDCVQNGSVFTKRYFDWKSDGVVRELSRRFLAILTAKDDGFPLSEGTNLTNALKRLQKTGVCVSDLLVDDHTLDLNTFQSVPITQEMLDNAETNRIQSYAFVGDKSFQGLKNAIYQNGVIILALRLDKNWWTAPNGTTSWAKTDLLTNNGHLRTPSDPATMGGHVCVAIGYTENGIIIQNSFSDQWCDAGFAMLGADYIPFIYEAATVIDMTPEQYKQITQANQIVNTVDQLQNVETPQNASLIASIIQMLWQKFTDLFMVASGRRAPSYGSAPRSPKWPAVEKAFLKEHPTCEACGSKGTLLAPLNVHHVQAFHINPALELDPANLMTLCRPHHLLIGHLMSWPSFNVDAHKDAAYFLAKIKARP